MAMGEKEIRIGDVSVSYMTEEDGIILTGGGRIGGCLDIPGEICGHPVKGIAKKAFLGQRTLRRVALPETCRYVEEWAFAQCPNLEVFVCGNKKLMLGKGVFNQCTGLQHVYIGTQEDGTKEERDVAVLLAALACRMEAEYLLVDQNRGSREWFEKWDKRLADFLAQADEDGYMTLALCGEEDIMLNIAQFMSEKRKQKCSMCLIRLKHDSHLSPQMREVFVSYMKELTKGCASQEAWLALFEEFAGDVSYYKVFADIGCVNADNMDAILLDMGQEFAQAKAFLLRYKEEHFEKVDVFAQFAL